MRLSFKISNCALRLSEFFTQILDRCEMPIFLGEKAIFSATLKMVLGTYIRVSAIRQLMNNDDQLEGGMKVFFRLLSIALFAAALPLSANANILRFEATLSASNETALLVPSIGQGIA